MLGLLNLLASHVVILPAGRALMNTGLVEQILPICVLILCVNMNMFTLPSSMVVLELIIYQ